MYRGPITPFITSVGAHLVGKDTKVTLWSLQSILINQDQGTEGPIIALQQWQVPEENLGQWLVMGENTTTVDFTVIYTPRPETGVVNSWGILKINFTGESRISETWIYSISIWRIHVFGME